MLLQKIKRPGGIFWYEMQQVRQDSDGTWLSGPVVSPWGAPHDRGTLAVPVVVLLAAERPWAAWWVGDPADQRLEIDICLPPETTASGWQYVDLELDPVLHEPGRRVEIEDWDEYAEACRNGWMTPADADLALTTAGRCADILKQGTEPWLRRGWHLLPDAQGDACAVLRRSQSSYSCVTMGTRPPPNGSAPGLRTAPSSRMPPAGVHAGGMACTGVGDGLAGVAHLLVEHVDGPHRIHTETGTDRQLVLRRT